MTDNYFIEIETRENASRVSRPSLAQVKALVQFMQQHPDLAQKKYRRGMSHEKFKKLWIELTNIANSIKGAVKSTKSWIKFWADKKRCLRLKQKQILEKKLDEKLSPLEQKIIDLSFTPCKTKKTKPMKTELCNGDDNSSVDEVLFKDTNMEFSSPDVKPATTADVQHISIMEKLVEVMDQQASAMVQLAQASLSNAKALERIAEASQIQALGAERVAATCERAASCVLDVRHALLSIDYTMKGGYPSHTHTDTSQHRPHAHLFS